MAGSYDHICDDDGSFRMDLIENMGDAHEALEECHGIIGRQRGALNEAWSLLDGDPTLSRRAHRAKVVLSDCIAHATLHTDGSGTGGG